MAVLTQMVELIQRFGDAPTAEIVYRQLLPFRPYPGALGTSTVYFMGTISRPPASWPRSSATGRRPSS
jgi:hypothetical protein